MTVQTTLTTAFERHAGWLVEQSAVRSIRELISWVAPRLSAEARTRFEELLPVAHPVQKAAEEALCDLLNSEESPTRNKRRRRRVNRPTRGVDWGETYARASWNPPLHYVEVQRSPRLDVTVMAALVHQARKWKKSLEACTKPNPERVEDLVDSIANAPGEWKHRSVALDESRLERLAQHDREAAEKIRRAMYLWKGSVREGNQLAFRNAIERAVECESEDVDNDDTLLEVLCAWSIARAAVEPGKDTGNRTWQFDGDPISENGAIGLRCDQPHPGLRCEIRACTSTRPRNFIWGDDNVPENEDGNKKYLDRQRALRALELGEENDGDGFQPDVTLHFTHAEEEGHLFAFADAKNYRESDLATAIKDTATAYLFAYGALCGRPPENAEHSPFEISTALRPPVTIFGRGDAASVMGVSAEEVDEIAAAFYNDRKAISPIVIFDDRHYLGFHESFQGEGEGWSVPVLEAWFARLADDAARAFEDGRSVDVSSPVYDPSSTRPRY